jgi:hypothetical protein
MTAVVYTETGSSDRHYLLRLNGSNLELFDLLSGTVLDSQPLASVTSYTINGSDENDTLVIEDLITLAGGVFFNGGLPIHPPGDAIVVTGAATSAMVTYTNSTDGVITLTSGVNSMTVHFTGVDPIDMTGSTPSSLVFNLPGGTDTILEDDGTAGNSTSQLRDQQAVPGFDTTVFAHPTAALTIDGGASDNLTVNLTDSLGAIALAINVGGTTTFTSFGAPELASVTTDAAGTTAINGGAVTTTGAQTYNDAVTLGAITTLTSTGSGNISLASTLNGAFGLTVNTSGSTGLFGVVGGVTALASLTTDAPGLTRVAANVTTTGAQSYGDQLALFADVALTSTAGGDIGFANVDNNSSLTINTVSDLLRRAL